MKTLLHNVGATEPAADQPGEAFVSLDEAYGRLRAVTIPRAGYQAMEEIRLLAGTLDGRPVDLSAVERSDREAALEDWPERYGTADPWKISPAPVGPGFDPAALSGGESGFRSSQNLMERNRPWQDQSS